MDNKKLLSWVYSAIQNCCQALGYKEDCRYDMFTYHFSWMMYWLGMINSTRCYIAQPNPQKTDEIQDTLNLLTDLRKELEK